MSGSYLWVLPFILFLIMSHRHVGSWVCGLAELLNLGLGHQDHNLLPWTSIFNIIISSSLVCFVT